MSRRRFKVTHRVTLGRTGRHTGHTGTVVEIWLRHPRVQRALDKPWERRQYVQYLVNCDCSPDGTPVNMRSNFLELEGATDAENISHGIEGTA